MNPMSFPESNRTLTKPAGVTDEECGSLEVFAEGAHCLSCWRMSWRERMSALLFGKTWLWVWSGGKTQPPVGLEVRRSLAWNEGDAHEEAQA